MAPLVLPITLAQAKELTGKIKRSHETTLRLFEEAHDRKAWEPLGYKSFTDYCRGEFDFSPQRGYQLLAGLKVIRALKAAADSETSQPATTRVDATERQARRIKPKLTEATDEIERRVQAGEPPEVVVPEVIQTFGAPHKIEPQGSPEVEEPATVSGSSTPSTAGMVVGTPGFGGPGKAPEDGPNPSGATDPTGQGDEGAEVEGDVGRATAQPDDGPRSHDPGDSASEPSPTVSKGEGGVLSGVAAVDVPAPSSPFTVRLAIEFLLETPDYEVQASVDDLRMLASWCHRNLAKLGHEDPHEVCRERIAHMQRILDKARAA